MARHLPVEQVRPYNATNSYLRPGAMEQPSVTGIPLELDPLTTPNSAPLTTSAPQSRLGEDDHALLPEYQASAAMKYRRIAELQGTRALPSRRSATKTRVVGKRKQRRRENSNLGAFARCCLFKRPWLTL